MSSDNFPHDSFFKKSMQDLRVAKDFFNLHLPLDIQDQVDLDTIAFEKTNFMSEREKISKKNKEKRLDMLYSVKINGEDGYFYLATEHQSTVDKDMPFRIMKYILEIIQYHLDKHKAEKNTDDVKYPIIWPVIFFNGDKPYNLTTSFLDMYPKGHRALAERILTSPFQLVDLNDIDNEALRHHVWAGIMELSMKANLAIYRDHLELLAKILAKMAGEIEHELGGWDFIKEAVWYTASIADTQSDSPDEYLKIIAEELSENNRGELMTTAAEKWKKEGVEQGIVKTACKMLKKKIDPKTISEVTDLPLEEIQKLQAKNQEDF